MSLFSMAKVLAFDADAILFATLELIPKSRTSSPGWLEAVLKFFFQHSASPESNDSQVQAQGSVRATAIQGCQEYDRILPFASS